MTRHFEGSWELEVVGRWMLGVGSCFVRFHGERTVQQLAE